VLFDFEEYAKDETLSASDWTVDGGPAELGFASEYEVSSVLSKAGSVGTFFEVPTGSTFSVSTTTTFSHASVDTLEFRRISVDLGVVDSYTEHPDTTDSYVDRNTFGFTYSDASSNPLITVTLTPRDQSTDPTNDTAIWDISYNFGQGEITTAYFLDEDSLSTFSLVFFNDSIGLLLNGEYFFTTATGYDPDTMEEGILSFFSEQGEDAADWGDNYLMFDNITLDTVVIPEASTAALAGLAALGMLRRRRA